MTDEQRAAQKAARTSRILELRADWQRARAAGDKKWMESIATERRAIKEIEDLEAEPPTKP